MKKAMSKNKKRTENMNRQNLEVDPEAVKIQRTVGDNEAFYFYEAVGKPTGEMARSLSDFMDKLTHVKTESLLFHHLRGDFPNWIEKVLGDPKLAGKLEKITSSSGDDVRMKIHKTVENRLKELRESSLATLVDENLTILSPSS